MDYPLESPRRSRTIIIKVSEAERAAIAENAKQHTHGNVSQWLRKAGISFQPVVEEEDAC